MSEERIQLGHGGGGLLGREFIEREIISRFGGGALDGLPDGARLAAPAAELVFSADSFVVTPPEFPGGSIGSLAVHGTVNDLAVSGARPLYLSLALILEEGLSLALLRRVLDDVLAASRRCGVQVVTGDTKVVPTGQCDGLYINTAGIGEMLPGFRIDPNNASPGDAVLVSGPLGDHGMAILATREGIELADSLRSDSAPVHRLVAAIGELAPQVRFMRDPTRGGAAATLTELVQGRPVGIILEEEAIPRSPGARSVAEALGFDLLHVASEGRLFLVCSDAAAGPILDRWRGMTEGAEACVMGRVSSDAGQVILRTIVGGERLVDVPQGELLPRIC